MIGLADAGVAETARPAPSASAARDMAIEVLRVLRMRVLLVSGIGGPGWLVAAFGWLRDGANLTSVRCAGPAAGSLRRIFFSGRPISPSSPRRRGTCAP